MLKSVNWSADRSYKSGTADEPFIFYLDALSNSHQMDLLLGYFSTAAINILSLGFAQFIANGGKLRLIINHFLSESDKEILLKSQKHLPKNPPIDLSNVTGLKSTLDEYGKHFFECLTWLFANNIFSIKVIKPLKKMGISHYKSGMFSDGTDIVGFRASCNFTAYGLLENLEELDVYCSWEDERSHIWLEKQKRYFEEIFTEKAVFVEYVPLEEIQVALKAEFGNKELQELIIDEAELIRKRRSFIDKDIIKNHLKEIEEKYQEAKYKPRFPYFEGPREYQKEAYDNWVANNRQGIFAMATGTGKTITAINCILNESRNVKDNLYKALILVPTTTLVKQWEKEFNNFNFSNIFCVYSQAQWQQQVTTFISRVKYYPLPFIIVTTYDTFVGEKFQLVFNKLPKDTIFIADEGHHLGRPAVQAKLKNFPFDRRIGLSATPKRYYDPMGTAIMEKFFSDTEPFTYTYSMEKAISDNVLCQYEYYPQIVYLSDQENEEYIELSKQLARIYYIFGALDESNIATKMLLLKRKRIIHKASNKLNEAIKILKRLWESKKSLKYTLIYVPEGSDDNLGEDDFSDSESGIRLIDKYAKAIAQIDDSIMVNQIYSGKADRDEIIEQFTKGQIHVLTSMKCLDEGIDIPRTETALFCSSTGNPRQFIQRRGRILRKHKDKSIATIYDLVIMPDTLSLNQDSDIYEIEKRMVKKELERVLYFASLSNNFLYSEKVFKNICTYYNLNLFTLLEELK